MHHTYEIRNIDTIYGTLEYKRCVVWSRETNPDVINIENIYPVFSDTWLHDSKSKTHIYMLAPFIQRHLMKVATEDAILNSNEEENE